MELRSYKNPDSTVTSDQRDKIMLVIRDYLARGQGIDGTFEFRFLPRSTDLDRCEYEYILVIDMGYSEEREKQKTDLAKAIGVAIAPILNTKSLAIRLRLQNAGFVPYKAE